MILSNNYNFNLVLNIFLLLTHSIQNLSLKKENHYDF